MITFDDAARKEIADLGGVYVGIVPTQDSEDVIVACETGVFRFSESCSVVWRSGPVGLVTSVEVTKTGVLINAGDPTELQVEF